MGCGVPTAASAALTRERSATAWGFMLAPGTRSSLWARIGVASWAQGVAVAGSGGVRQEGTPGLRKSPSGVPDQRDLWKPGKPPGLLELQRPSSEGRRAIRMTAMASLPLTTVLFKRQPLSPGALEAKPRAEGAARDVAT